MANRARLMFEVLEVVSAVWGSERVGLRLSPLNRFNGMSDSDPVGLASWLAEQLNPLNLAYLHLMRGDFLGPVTEDVVTPVRERYRGVLIANMGYTPAEAEAAIGANQCDAVAFGVPFIANPDLVERIRNGEALNEADMSTFYTPGPEGYIDYPFLAGS